MNYLRSINIISTFESIYGPTYSKQIFFSANFIEYNYKAVRF